MLREELNDSYNNYLYESSLSTIKASISKIAKMPANLVKRKVVSSWNTVKSNLGGTDKETKLLDFYNYIFNKKFGSFADLDYMFVGLQEAITLDGFLEFFKKHSVIITAAAMALTEAFIELMGFSPFTLALVYVTIAIGLFLYENEDEISGFFAGLKAKIGKYFILSRKKTATSGWSDAQLKAMGASIIKAGVVIKGTGS